MGKGSYYGGSTVIRPGSGWFAYKRKVKVLRRVLRSYLGNGDVSRLTAVPSELERQAAARLKANADESRRQSAQADAAKAKAIDANRRARRADEEKVRKVRKAAAKAARAPLRKARRIVGLALKERPPAQPVAAPAKVGKTPTYRLSRVHGMSFVVTRGETGQTVVLQVDEVTRRAKGAARQSPTKPGPDEGQ